MLNHARSSARDGDPVDRLVAAWATEVRLQPPELGAIFSAISAEVDVRIGLKLANELPQRLAVPGWLPGVGLAKQMALWAASRPWQTWPHQPSGELGSRWPSGVAWGNVSR
jgi:hypothetical protein